jgi:hypothetical protein
MHKRLRVCILIKIRKKVVRLEFYYEFNQNKNKGWASSIGSPFASLAFAQEQKNLMYVFILFLSTRIENEPSASIRPLQNQGLTLDG